MTAKVPACFKVHSSSNVSLEEAVKGQITCNNLRMFLFLEKAEVSLMAGYCPLNPPPSPSVNNKTKLRD